MSEWIDSSKTPTLAHTNQHCVLLMPNDGFPFHIGIYSFPDGWFDCTEGKEIIKEQFLAYMPLYKPRKKVHTETIVEWK